MSSPATDLRARLRAADAAPADRDHAVDETLAAAMRAGVRDPQVARRIAADAEAVLPDAAAALARSATPEFARALLEDGDEAIVLDLIERWRAPDGQARLGRLALDVGELVAAVGATPRAMIALARAAAVWAPLAARRLVDQARTRAGSRDFGAPEADDAQWLAGASETLGRDAAAARRGLAACERGLASDPDARTSADVAALEEEVMYELRWRRADAKEPPPLADTVGRFAPDLVARARARIPPPGPPSLRRSIPPGLAAHRATVHAWWILGLGAAAALLRLGFELRDTYGSHRREPTPDPAPAPIRAAEDPEVEPGTADPLTPEDARELARLRAAEHPLSPGELRRLEDLSYRERVTRRR